MTAPTVPGTGTLPSAEDPAAPSASVPIPRTRPTPAWTPPDYLALALSRLRATQPVEAVSFTAPCPACGDNCEWAEEREDTRLLISLTCGCAAGPR